MMQQCLAAALAVSPDEPIVAEAALIRRAAAGELAAYEQLYRSHAARVHGLLLRLSGFDVARAEDWTQDCFIRAWQQLGEFRQQCRFGTWLHRLAVNVALMALRAERAAPLEFVDDAALPEVADVEFCAAERDQLERAIAALPPRARAVFVLHDVEGWPHRDIGRALGMAAGTSKAQLHRARAALRQTITQGVRR